MIPQGGSEALPGPLHMKLCERVCLCVIMVMPVPVLHVCFISQCQGKSVVCPSSRTGTVEVLVGSYDSALQH